MATVVWEGGAASIKQVDKATPGGTIEADDVFIVTINGKDVSAIAGGTTVADVTAAVKAAWDASGLPEASTITATDDTMHITFTAVTAGVPFTITVSTTEAGGVAADAQTFVKASVTAISSPNSWDNADNWSSGAVPAGGDDVVFENSTTSCLYGLDQANAIASLAVKANFTGHIGLPRDNSGGYAEYLPTELDLKTAVTSVKIGEGEGDGSGRIKLGTGILAGNLTISVYKTGVAAEDGVPPLLITTGTQSNTTTLNVNRGTVGVAFFAGETAEVDVLNVTYITTPSSDSTVYIGSGITGGIGTIDQTAGSVDLECTTTTVTARGSTLTIGGTATVTTLTLTDGATCYYDSSGTATTINVLSASTLDFRRDSNARTVANANVYAGTFLYDPNATVTWTNGIDLEQCDLDDVTLQIGANQTISLSAID